MDRSLLAWSKLTNVLSHHSQSYFLPNPSPHTQKRANFTVWGTVQCHISIAPQRNPLKSRSETLTNRCSLASIKVTKALQHFPQSYSHFHIPKLKNSANF